MTDLKFALRQLLKNPGFTAVAVLTLALGIGAITAIFSIVNAVVLQPLPLPAPERMVQVLKRSPHWTVEIHGEKEVLAWQRENPVLEQMAVYAPHTANLSGVGEAARVPIMRVSASFLPLLGTQPVLGRNFVAEEDQPGGPLVAIVSHGLWQRQFGGAADIVGRTLTLDNQTHTILGVLPSTLRTPEAVDVFLPFALQERTDFARPVGSWERPEVIGRLNPGVTLKQAEAALQAIYEAADPNPNRKDQVVLVGLQEHLVGDVKTPLLVFLGAVGFVLLIACANVASLMLARAANRQREMAIRAALGAGRTQIARQLLTESLLLALIGGALGLLVALGSLGLLRPLIAHLPAVRTVTLDGWALAFTFLVSLFTGLAFGLAPALAASRASVRESLNEGARQLAGSASRRNVRAALVVMEMAIALVLLAGAGLMLNSFVRLRGVDPGFRPERLLSFTITLSPQKYPDPHSQAGFFEQVLERLRGLNGVEAVGADVGLPLTGFGMGAGLGLEGRPLPPGSEFGVACSIVNDDCFRALGIPLKRGRGFTSRDRDGAPGVVVVNERFARTYFPDEDPLGKRIKGGFGAKDWQTIVGVVGDVHQHGLAKEAPPVLYQSYLQAGHFHMSFVVRTRGDPLSLAKTVREVIAGVDPTQPVYDVMTLEQRLAGSLAWRRFTTSLMSVFSALAVGLAALGIYGVIAGTVTQRTQEIGIRIALGAQRRSVLGLVLRQGLWLALVGMALGLMGGLALSRLIASQLYGVKSGDPLTFLCAVVALFTVALLACLVPALRATRVDPMVALRYE